MANKSASGVFLDKDCNENMCHGHDLGMDICARYDEQVSLRCFLRRGL